MVFLCVLPAALPADMDDTIDIGAILTLQKPIPVEETQVFCGDRFFMLLLAVFIS